MFYFIVPVKVIFNRNHDNIEGNGDTKHIIILLICKRANN